MNRIALIICYIGPFPMKYFRYFVDSSASNSDIDFFIFGDSVSQPEISGNIKILPLTLAEFNRLASQKLGLDINLTHGYKLCELHPAYGLIFEDYLKSYDFWGHCDMDIVWGRISHFITEDMLMNFDVITSRQSHITGHFTLYRNSGIALELFRQTDDYIKVFTDGTTHYHFDEACLRYGKFHSPNDLRQSGQTVSMSDIVMDLKQKGQVRLYMQNLTPEYPEPICYVYRDGVLTDLTNDQEFMYFHLNHVKNDWKFFIPPTNKLPSKFRVLPEWIVPGLPGDLLSRLKWQINKNLFSLSYLLGRVKQFGISSFLKKLTKKFAL